MTKVLKNTDFESFYEVNEQVAHTSPMHTHYHSQNPLERILWQQKKQVIRSLIQEIPIKNILDLGCGDGGMVEIVSSTIDYTGIDISPTQINHAKKHVQELGRSNAKLMIGDILNLKFKDNTFDAALLCDVVEHVLSPEKLFSEVKRVTKKNGYIIFSIPNEFLWELTRALLLRFPLRSPDHLHAIFPQDIKKNFSSIIQKRFIPVSFSSHLSLIHVFLIKNEK